MDSVANVASDAPKLQMINTIQSFGLPIDENRQNELKQVRGYNYSRVTPTLLKNVRICSLSADCMKWLGLSSFSSPEAFKNKNLAELLCGNKLFVGSKPLSHCYCGHQFGYFSGQLGDGRAISLGDVPTHQNDQNNQIIQKLGLRNWNLVDLQIKGGGLTPYSRKADGRAVLRSSIREYLCSEAMWSLGIPTTRAASLVVSDTTVKRDKLYTGNVIDEKCAVVLRVAPSFMRFGSFEIFKPVDNFTGCKGPSNGLKNEMLPKMLDYLLEYFYTRENAQKLTGGETKYQKMFEAIVVETAEMASLWQCYGFCHGVLNTDNMSILSLTIDYGPYGWMEHFDPDYICNHSDNDRGRYRYKAQPEICKWNLLKLCEALEPALDIKFSTDFVKNNYDKFYNKAYLQKMASKLGLLITEPVQVASANYIDLGTHKLLTNPQQKFRALTKQELDCIQGLTDTMAETGSDFTDTFRILADVGPKMNSSDPGFKMALDKLVQICAPMALLDKKNESQFAPEQIEKLEEILANQPSILPMLGLDIDMVKQEIAKAKKQQSQTKDKDKQIKEKASKDRAAWQTWLAQYIEVLENCQEIKAYENVEAYNQARRESMNSRVNPKYILRNYLLEEAIKLAEANDFTKINEMLTNALNPFVNDDKQTIVEKRPDSRFKICVSCSS